MHWVLALIGEGECFDETTSGLAQRRKASKRAQIKPLVRKKKRAGRRSSIADRAMLAIGTRSTRRTRRGWACYADVLGAMVGDVLKGTNVAFEE